VVRAQKRRKNAVRLHGNALRIYVAPRSGTINEALTLSLGD